MLRPNSMACRAPRLPLPDAEQKPFITAPIVGASKPHHLDDAVAAIELKLDARTIAKLEEPYQQQAGGGARVADGRTRS